VSIELPLDAIVYRQDLYPRIKTDPSLVQKYARSLELLPPISVNQDNILIDGWHRWTAHKEAKAPTIQVVVTRTASERELYALACESNAAHGWQMDRESKRQAAIRLYGLNYTAEEIGRLISWRKDDVLDATRAIREEEEKERDRRIFELWMACATQQEIADKVGIPQQTVADKLSVLPEQFPGTKSVKLSDFSEDEWKAPIYNVWTFAKKSNTVDHFGNSEQQILDNLLWLYTNRYDVVFDPFAGGGATIDVCQRRLRRYYVSDRKPTPARGDAIRLHDLTIGLPRLPWSEVALTYLDPPYWRQAKGKYSDDAEDLANMPLDQFTKTLVDLINAIGKKQTKGAIALLIQPTQWSADDRHFTDHVTDVVSAVGNKRLRLVNRVSCPYNSEQYNAQQVEWAKTHKRLLVLTRELVVWDLLP